MSVNEKSKIQKQIVDEVKFNSHGRLLLAPRVGKSKIIIDIIKRDKPKSILWVTPSAKLADGYIQSEFKKWKADKYLESLKISTWASLNKVEGNFDLIVLDEEQHITELNSKNLIEGKLSGRIISMTGTPSKDKEKKEIYKKLRLKVLYEVSINEAVDLGLLSDYQINVIMIPKDYKKMSKYRKIKYVLDGYNVGTIKVFGNIAVTDTKVSFSLHPKESKYGGDLYTMRNSERTVGYLILDKEKPPKGKITSREGETFKITDGIIHKPYPKSLLISRSKAIGTSELKEEVAKSIFKDLEGRKIIFTSSIEQCEGISKYTYHSKTTDEHLEKFQFGDIDEIAMVNSGGTGFTYKEIDHLIMVQVDSNNNGMSSQKICRTLLNQENYKANIWILCVKDTQDEKWVESTLKSFDKSKVKFIDYGNK